ncbi:hypothetical protein BEWA_029400 [Theileria equi strain WA]|uniref:Uncharacterized protein n=1 Tax=Theileria equi strain WA TaxID=1537102 RepID=L0AX04_THEEQ|nr:hypothetical protein BEWA_029400 [Theileria equi strain WA]AFZ80090.1 hypothetical protein BEWA_029400 [Theileria equi strain WA]|eukprot:XP_004829756.1 hypothetical protein BEWA_029400 [Theileria equi strain WA]
MEGYLDISPKRLNEQLRYGISGTKHVDSPKPYTKYEYKSIAQTSFMLVTVSYDGITLNQIRTPTHEILRLCTYFTDDETLITVHLETRGINYYYTTVDAKITGRYEFRGFKTSAELTGEEIKIFVDNVSVNGDLDFQGLPRALREKLYRKNDVFFNVYRNHWDEGYSCKCTNISIKITKGGEIGDYQSLQHKPNISSFYIGSIYYVEDKPMCFDNDLPSEPLDSLTVYKNKFGNDKINPMMVILNVQTNPGCVPGRYIIAKYYANVWSIRRIGATSISSTEIAEIFKVISDDVNHRLNVNKLSKEIQEKLKDITKDLSLDLTHQLNLNEGIYISVGNMKIPYKQTNTGQYLVVSYAHTFNSFTVQDVKVKGVPVGDSLIPFKTRLSRFKAYYNENSTNNPLLIYMMYLNGKVKWICRHDGCDYWEELEKSIPSSCHDSPSIINILSSLRIPTVAINLSKNVGLYTPAGSNTKLHVSRTSYSGYDFYKCTQHRGESQSELYPLKISHICYNATLYGIESQEILSSVGAFYDGESPVFEEPFMIELVTYNPKKYWYYQRVDKSASAWKKRVRRDDSIKMIAEQIKTELMNLRGESIPIPGSPPPS